MCISFRFTSENSFMPDMTEKINACCVDCGGFYDTRNHHLCPGQRLFMVEEGDSIPDDVYDTVHIGHIPFIKIRDYSSATIEPKKPVTRNFLDFVRI